MLIGHTIFKFNHLIVFKLKCNHILGVERQLMSQMGKYVISKAFKIIPVPPSNPGVSYSAIQEIITLGLHNLTHLKQTKDTF